MHMLSIETKLKMIKLLGLYLDRSAEESETAYCN